MTEPLPRDEARIRLVSDTMKHRWRLIVLLAVVFGVVAGGYMLGKSAVYRSTAIVLLRPLTGNALSTTTAATGASNTVAMETEASLVASQPVTDRVNKALGTHFPASSAIVAVSVPANSQIIDITCKQSQPSLAQRCAQRYAIEFLNVRTDLASSALQGQLTKLRAQVTQVQDDLLKASTEAAGPKPPSDAATRVKLYSANLSALLSEISRVGSTTTDPGSVILSATHPPAPSRKALVLVSGGAVVAGLLLGFVLGLWRERRQDLVRGAAEPDVSGLPVLAVIPHAPNVEAGRLPGHDEAVRRARVAMLASAGTDCVLAFAGVDRSSGQRTVAADIAQSLASAGYRITLVDATVQRGEAQPLLGVAEEVGLAQVLENDPEGDLPLTTVDGVRVLPAGATTPAGRDQFAGQGLRRVLQRLRAEADLVVVACADAQSSDGQSVALATDRVVLVGVDGSSTHAAVVDAAHVLQRLGIDVIGLALQQPVPTKVVKAAAKEAGAKKTGGAKHEHARDGANSTAPATAAASDSADTAGSEETAGRPSAGGESEKGRRFRTTRRLRPQATPDASADEDVDEKPADRPVGRRL